MDKFIKINEASTLSGRSKYEIRQWTKAKLHEQQVSISEAEKQGQQADVEIVVKQKNMNAHKDSPLVYWLREDEVIRRFGKATTPIDNISDKQETQAPTTDNTQNSTSSDRRTDELIEILRDQLEKKDRQLQEKEESMKAKDRTITELSKVMATLSLNSGEEKNRNREESAQTNYTEPKGDVKDAEVDEDITN